MPTKSTAQLKEWFRKGCYPKEEHFADLIDSYFHKKEGEIEIARIKELPERLNDKYPKSAGQELESEVATLRDDFDSYREQTDVQIDNIVDNLEEIEEVDERQQSEIDTLQTRLDDARADIDDEIARAQAAEAQINEALSGTVADDDPRLSDPREANGGFTDSIINKRNTVEHYEIWVGTQEEYDAIDTKETTTIYYTI